MNLLKPFLSTCNRRVVYQEPLLRLVLLFHRQFRLKGCKRRSKVKLVVKVKRKQIEKKEIFKSFLQLFVRKRWSTTFQHLSTVIKPNPNHFEIFLTFNHQKRTFFPRLSSERIFHLKTRSLSAKKISKIFCLAESGFFYFRTRLD